MLLAIDTGNSDITMGLWSEGRWKNKWRIPSRPEQPELFYGLKIREALFEANVEATSIGKVVLSSVVPELTAKLQNIVEKLFHRKSILLGPAVYDKLPLKILNPYEIGADLVANAVAAFSHYKKTCIVVDFGTALTFTTIEGSGKIIGVAIAPGLVTAVKSLTQNTAKLFDVPLQMPASVLGTNTVTAIQSGILIGYGGLVKAMIEAIRREVGTACPAVATGGLSGIIAPLHTVFDIVNPDLTLDGLRLIGEQLQCND